MAIQEVQVAIQATRMDTRAVTQGTTDLGITVPGVLEVQVTEVSICESVNLISLEIKIQLYLLYKRYTIWCTCYITTKILIQGKVQTSFSLKK